MTSTISTKKCSYMPLEGDDTQLLRQAFSFFFNLCHSNRHKEGFIAINTPGAFENIISQSKEFAALKPLLTRKQMKFGTIFLNRIIEYKMNHDDKVYCPLPKDASGKPLLALYPSEEFLLNLDKIRNVSAMIVVPFLEREVLEWIEANGAENLLDDKDNDENNIPIAELDQRIKDLILNELNIDFKRRDWDVNVALKSRSLFTKIKDMELDYDPRAVKYYLLSELKWNLLAVDRVYRIAKRIRSEHNPPPILKLEEKG